MAHVERHPSLTLLLRLAAAGSVFASLGLLGCEDPPPSATRPERLIANEPDAAPAVRWAADDVPVPADDTAANPSMTLAADGDVTPSDGFTIRDLSTSTGAIAGPERFTVKVIVASPQGSGIKGYGIKTPYEDGVHAFATLPMAVANGQVQVKVDPLSTMPKKGHYPFEFWLVNDRHEASNHLRGDITVQ